jgi:REP element-mobilizing transposase RayT
MARELRAIDPEAIYHAAPVGSNKNPIIFDDRDAEWLLEDVAKTAERYRWDVLAWCVMSTHYHLVLRMPNGGFSEGFQQINGNHSRRTNRRWDRKAHLFQNRPFALEVKTQAHLVSAILYVLRNPIEAGICKHASHWPHSSYRATAGTAPAPTWLNRDTLRELFGNAAEFERLVHSGHVPVSDTTETAPAPTSE